MDDDEEEEEDRAKATKVIMNIYLSQTSGSM
jgi:hypothetical protein